MNNRECELIRDLLPLYADGEASGATLELVERHLSGCAQCREMLEVYRQPALPGLTREQAPEKAKKYFSSKLHQLAFMLVAALVMTASTIAWASYQVGRNAALRDPSFTQAQEMDLFTEVRQAKKLGPHVITVDRILADTARTTVFYRVDPALDSKSFLQIDMADDRGVHYDARGGRGLKGSQFVYDLDPVNVDARKIILTFSTGEIPEKASFEIPVDPTRVAEKTREIYPGLKAAAGPAELALDKAVLGLSESIFFFRIRWPEDPAVAGIGVGLNPPMQAKMGPGGPVSAGGRVSRPPPSSMIDPAGAFPPDFWADLTDVTNGKRIKLDTTRTQTDPVTGGIRGSFHFGPVEPSARDLKLTLPPLYLYRFPEEDQAVEFTWPKEGELKLDRVFHRGLVSFSLEKVVTRDKELAFYFKYQGGGDKPPHYYRPDFRLKDRGFWREQMRLEWPDPTTVKITFPLPEDERVALKLNSLGERLPRVEWEINAAQ
ncbi:MAG: zf-HC2 domain-containing protein [Bacillota bacterium]